ncbi:MAG: CinA family protein, partial [Deltaproteobacteria bacterium]|nr:CinA family protein [Deltaproteobacteria bacterium]
MRELLPIAEKIAEVLKTRRETIGVAESSSGGLISSALLAVAGASAYYLGGAVAYTLQSRRALLDLPDSAFSGLRGLTEELAL